MLRKRWAASLGGQSGGRDCSRSDRSCVCDLGLKLELHLRSLPNIMKFLLLAIKGALMSSPKDQYGNELAELKDPFH